MKFPCDHIESEESDEVEAEEVPIDSSNHLAWRFANAMAKSIL